VTSSATFRNLLVADDTADDDDFQLNTITLKQVSSYLVIQSPFC